MKKKGILILSYISPEVIKKLKKNFNIYLKPPSNRVNLENIEILILDIRVLSEIFLNKLINLKLIARFGVGYDNINLDFIKKRKIKLALTRNAVIKPVAEHTLTLIFNILRKVNKYNFLVKKNNYSQTNLFPKTYDISKKNILLIGYGAIGSQVAKFLRPYDCNIFFYDPFLKKIKTNKITRISLNKGLRIGDIISLHMPLNKFTHKFVDNKFLSMIKNDAILINTSRGRLVDEKSLVKKLKKNKEFFAGLDVFYNEPIKKNHPLIRLENTILTPHVSTSTIDTRYNMSMEVLQNITNYLNKRFKNKNFLKLNNEKS